jgi:hypothetical protein
MKMAAATLTTRETLDEAYFTRAARELNDHYCRSGSACTACGGAWPCERALAAAFVLDMHT